LYDSNMTSWLAENLSVLEIRDPALALQIATASDAAVEAKPAADGTPNLWVGGVALHNVHAPALEAQRWAEDRLAAHQAHDAAALVVLGFGAGHHLRALAACSAQRIVVIEPNLGVLRAALRGADLREVLQRVEIRRDEPGTAELERMGRVAVLPFGPGLGSDRATFGRIRRALHGRIGRQRFRLRILVLGPMHGGSLPLAGFAARALARLGHDVTFLDMAPFADGFRHIPAFGARGAAQEHLEATFVDWLAEGILRRVEQDRPHLVLALAQAPVSRALLERLAAQDVATALWFVEDFRRFPYWQQMGPLYRYVFTIQRDECLAAFEAAGIANAFYLPCAADPAVHAPCALGDAERREIGSAVSFVGAGYHNRRATFRRLLGLDFRIWGSEWEGASGLWDTVVQRGGARLSTADCVRVFNATDVNLNLHSSTYVDGVDPIGDFVNPRTFELAACGAFQLVDERRLLPELLVPGVEVATFASAGELRERVEHYLARPEERRAVAAAGRRRVLAEHTYEARMAQMLEHIFGVDYERYAETGKRPRGKAVLIAAAGAETALGRYLERACPDVPEVGVEHLAAEVHAGHGALSDEEAIWVFLKQYDAMFLESYRAAGGEGACAS
jgi:spore maturation protein CgeB